jgi:3-oxoacyl-[acyl-carrier-protein] synthase-1
MYIGRTGMVCPVGLGAATACAAMRASVAGFGELPYLDNLGQPVIGAAVPGLSFDLRRSRRLALLLARALTDLLDGQPELKTEHIPLIVGMAEPERPGGSGGSTDTIVVAVEEELKLHFHRKLTRVVATGHTAGFEALWRARTLLQESPVPACIVACVDSCINSATLHWLEQHTRLKTPQNSNGVIPGEAAAALLVQIHPPDRFAAMRVAGIGFSTERVAIFSDEPFLGLGLAEATRQALSEAGQELHDMCFRLSDVTGESYGFKEQSLMLSRVMRGRRSEFPIWHCADLIGDTGAAASICHLVRAFEAFVKGYAPGEPAIAFASGVSGRRAAAVLRWDDDRRGRGGSADVVTS